jgi:tetratricopeptide (TPR) repeat protein
VIFGLLKENLINMKKIFLTLLSVYSFTLFAATPSLQIMNEDSLECLTKRSVFTQFVKQKNYVDAYSPWRWAFVNCPSSSKNIYIDGAKIIKSKIKEFKSQPDILSAYVDTLFTIYDMRISYFGQQGFISGVKGSDMMRYRSKTQLEEAHQLLKTSVELEGSKSRATALYYYFKSVSSLTKKGILTKADVLEAYATVTQYVEYNLANNSKSVKSYQQSLEKIEKEFEPYATCEDLVALFDSKYSESPDDLSLLKRIVDVLNKKECTDAEVYFNAASAVHAAEPTASSSFSMGNLSVNKGKFDAAIGFYNQAMSLTDSDIDKSKYLLGLSQANVKLGKLSTARDLAYQSAKLNPAWGKPYVLIGDMYLNSVSTCGTNVFEQGMVYSAAIDKYIKAKNIDSSLREQCNKKIALYTKYLPANNDAFFSGAKDGDVYQVGCWINETTKVRIQ